MKKRKFPVFWCIYAVLVAASLVVIHIELGQVEVFLAKYEASQPKHTAKAVFDENFADFDALSYLEKFDDALFGLETRENVAAYLTEKTKGEEFSYYSISTKEDGTYKYSVKAGNVKIAGFTLYTDEIAPGGFATYTADDFEVYFATNEDITVTVPKGAVVSLNGIQIDETYIIENDIPDSHNQYLPEGVTGKYYTKYKASGFVTVPEVKVVCENSELTIVESEEGYETVSVYNDELKAEYSDYVLSALQNYATYIQGRYSNGGVTLDMVTKFFDPQSHVYATVKKVSNKYVNSYDSYEFRDEMADEFIQYDENTFSCRVSFDQVLHRSGAEDYVDHIDYTLYLRKIGDEFLIFDMQHE